jgi:hypothetical protein
MGDHGQPGDGALLAFCPQPAHSHRHNSCIGTNNGILTDIHCEVNMTGLKIRRRTSVRRAPKRWQSVLAVTSLAVASGLAVASCSDDSESSKPPAADAGGSWSTPELGTPDRSGAGGDSGAIADGKATGSDVADAGTIASDAMPGVDVDVAIGLTTSPDGGSALPGLDTAPRAGADGATDADGGAKPSSSPDGGDGAVVSPLPAADAGPGDATRLDAAGVDARDLGPLISRSVLYYKADIPQEYSKRGTDAVSNVKIAKDWDQTAPTYGHYAIYIKDWDSVSYGYLDLETGSVFYRDPTLTGTLVEYVPLPTPVRSNYSTLFNVPKNYLEAIVTLLQVLRDTSKPDQMIIDYLAGLEDYVARLSAAIDAGTLDR